MRARWRAYLERYAKPQKRSWQEDEHAIKSRILSAWVFREVKRDRWVTPDELPRLAQAINEQPNEAARFALWLYLLTGARRTDLLREKWADVDWTRCCELRLPETKAGRVHNVPLSAPALALLRELPRAAGNPDILPGKGPGS